MSPLGMEENIWVGQKSTRFVEKVAFVSPIITVDEDAHRGGGGGWRVPLVPRLSRLRDLRRALAFQAPHLNLTPSVSGGFTGGLPILW
jgi:hypothetical protein